MRENNRPEGWDITRITERLALPCDQNGILLRGIVTDLVEAGADAMYEALRDKGLYAILETRTKGLWVYHPDEEDE